MSQQQPSQPTAAGRAPEAGVVGRRKRVLFRLLAVGVGLLPLLLVESGLRMAGIANPRHYHDPLVGFSQLHPLFEPVASEGVYRTSRSRELFFGVQQFPAIKSDDEFRIFCLGGSTVRGHPYETDTAFAQWLQMELAACDPSRRYTVVNCGGISYASYRLRIILDEVLRHQPDLIVVATGHNEFLEDRTYGQLKHRSPAWARIEDAAGSLRTVVLARRFLRSAGFQPAGSSERTILSDTVRAKLDDETGYASYHRDDAWRAGVVEHFERSVQGMVLACQAAEVPLLLVNLGSNLRSTPPFKSEHAAGLATGDQLRWQQLFDQASALDGDDPRQALAFYQQAEAIDDRYALLSFRIARCLDRLGRFDDAKRYYCKAKDEDICPLRMLDSMYLRQQQIAADSHTPIIDARQLLESRSAQSIPGDDWYLDHVHPTIDGHQAIAGQIAAWMRQVRLPDALPQWDPRQRRQAYQRHLHQLGDGYFFNGKERVGWLENWARAQRLYHEALPVDGRGNLHRGMRRYGFGEIDGAWQDFHTALDDDPSLVDDLLQFALRLMQQGRIDQSWDAVQRLAEHPAAAAIEQPIALAQWVLAVQRDDAPAMWQWLQRHGGPPPEVLAARSAWFDAAPDTRDRARDLLDDAPAR